MRALNNSNDHVLAFGANFSQVADSHLVCMQSDADHSYHTQAINIHNKPRKGIHRSYVINICTVVSCIGKLLKCFLSFNSDWSIFCGV